jgi:hypothetical protein
MKTDAHLATLRAPRVTPPTPILTAIGYNLRLILTWLGRLLRQILLALCRAIRLAPALNGLLNRRPANFEASKQKGAPP